LISNVGSDEMDETMRTEFEKKLDNDEVPMDGTGKRFNVGKPRLDLLVPEALEAEARVWELGETKYGRWNWQKGMKWSTVIGCMLRHTFAIMRGEDVDKESGELHAAHIKCNATMLIYYYENFKAGDDRANRSKTEKIK
jgi:hypothetical protein